ncbi:hypothetical protein [Persephonella sp.]
MIARVLSEAIATAEYLEKENVKGTAIFKMPVHLFKGKFVEGGGLPVYMSINKYPKAGGRGIKINFFSIDGNGRAVLAKPFRYHKSDVAEKIKDRLSYLREKTRESRIPLDQNVYEEIKPFARSDVEIIAKKVEQQRKRFPDEYSADKEHVKEAWEKMKALREYLQVFFMNVGIVNRIDDSEGVGRKQYIHVVVEPEGRGYFRTKLSSSHENLYRLLVQAEPPMTGVLGNRAGGLILADTEISKLVSQAKRYEPYTPAQLEIMKEELERKVKEKPIMQPRPAPAMR